MIYIMFSKRIIMHRSFTIHFLFCQLFLKNILHPKLFIPSNIRLLNVFYLKRIRTDLYSILAFIYMVIKALSCKQQYCSNYSHILKFIHSIIHNAQYKY